jgi:hypothetical protein
MKAPLIVSLVVAAFAAACTNSSTSDSDGAGSALELTPTQQTTATNVQCECRGDVANWMVQLGLFDRSTGKLVEQLAYWSYGSGATGPELAESHAEQMAKCERKLAEHVRCR